MDEDILELIEIVEMLCDGLEWNIENHPTTHNGCDEEALDLARHIVVKIKSRNVKS